MKNLFCTMGLHKDKQVGFGNITMPLGVFHCQRCGEVWKWGVDCARITLVFESEEEKNEYLGLPPPKEQLKLGHKK